MKYKYKQARKLNESEELIREFSFHVATWRDKTKPWSDIGPRFPSKHRQNQIGIHQWSGVCERLEVAEAKLEQLELLLEKHKDKS